MKFLLRSNPNLWRRGHLVLRAQLFSTDALTSSSYSSSAPIGTLYGRISRSGNAELSIIPVLEKWFEEGKDVKQSELLRIIKQLRKYRRFKHALQVSCFSIFCVSIHLPISFSRCIITCVLNI